MDPARLGYAVLFAFAGVVCLGVIPRARRLSDADTRRGLVALLVTCGGWALLTVGQVIAGSLAVKTSLYTIGLAFGFATVFPWLYFCSAYSGRRYHHNPTLRALAVACYLTVVGLKFTNPVHGLYFAATLDPTPFPHLVIQRSLLNWLTTVLAYLLSAAGFLMLFQVLRRSGYSTESLWVTVGFAALPVLPSVAAIVPGVAILDLSYEPIGVALFALGVLYFVEEKFTSVRRFGREQLFDEIADPVVVLDDEDRVLEYNEAAPALFPSLEGAVGQPLTDVAAQLTATPDESEVVSISTDGRERYFVRRTSELTVGAVRVGCVLVLTDVTELERNRRELTRQNAQLDDFAAAVDHELRNTVSLIEGYAEIAREHADDESTDDALAVIERTSARMAGIVGDLTTLARYGQTLDETKPCDLEQTVRAAWERTTPEGLTLTVEQSGTVTASPDRLTALFDAAFEFASVTGADNVTIGYEAGELTITTDGDPIPNDRCEAALNYNAAVPSAKAGMLLPNVRTLATVHGWQTALDPEYEDGVRIQITGIEDTAPPVET
ncbi:histidine kinase N-terminal 7TM domain-containing protein [Halosegnis sp.]|uniref:histidine kinase N-terminal 7TM domain-containing protein n=1 Tax=Halosegnis sp. TaxID=2864959 RepID=UPI0035D3EA5B